MKISTWPFAMPLIRRGDEYEDYARRQRGDVKAHEEALRACVSKLFPEDGYGFLETPDGREIYFHRRSVLHPGFDRLAIGTASALC